MLTSFKIENSNYSNACHTSAKWQYATVCSASRAFPRIRAGMQIIAFVANVMGHAGNPLTGVFYGSMNSCWSVTTGNVCKIKWSLP